MTRRWLAAAVLVAVLALAGIFGWRVYRGGEGATTSSVVATQDIAPAPRDTAASGIETVAGPD